MTYPASIDSFSSKTAHVDLVKAVDWNAITAAITAIETELGIVVRGSSTDLVTRLGKALSGAGLLQFAAATTLTIATGSVTATQNYHRLDTEAAAASDDLDTITAGSEAQVLIVRTVSGARNVVIKHGTGNINCNGGSDITLDNAYDMALLVYDASLAVWLAAGFMSTAALAAAIKYGGFYAYNKSILFQITVSNVYHALHLVTAGDFTAGILSGFTFSAGRTVDANITSEGNPSGAVLLITCSANHGLTTGQIVMLGNMNNAAHNGPTKITSTGLTTFTCDDITYVAGAGASAGTVVEPTNLLASAGSTGIYSATFTIDGTAAGANKDWKFELNVNLTAQDNIVSERNTTGTLASISSNGHISISAGDRVWVSAKNATDTGDYTIKNCNIALHQL